MELIHRSAKIDEHVFDGSSGYGVFRPHAYEYWFFHGEVQLMLAEEDLTSKVISALERTQAPIVILDEWSRQLPGVVHDCIEREYGGTPFDHIKILRE